jgi:hypothetical protein
MQEYYKSHFHTILGIVDGSKQSKKEFCWQYYKSQMLYIEAMQEAKNDSEYDPRRNDRHPAAGPGLSGALGPLRRCGEEEQGGSEGLLEALHAGKGTGKGKTKCGWVKGRLR